MFGRMSRGLLVAAAVLLAAMWPGAAATADDTWHGAGCGTGRLTGAALDDTTLHVVVFGAATLCSDAVRPGGEFALATFLPGGTEGLIHVTAIRSYGENPSRERTFGIDAGAEARIGVCLIASPSSRIACGEVTTGADGAVFLDIIPASDPLVRASIDPVVRDVPEPNCGSCF
jgi:hypothetical protein